MDSRVTQFMTPEASKHALGISREREAEALGFDAIYGRYSAYVASIAYRLLGRDTEVDDVVQDVFLQVHRRGHTIRPDAVRGWLSVTTVRAARRRIQKRRLLGWLGLSTGEIELVDPHASPEHSSHVRSMARAVDQMPTDERIVWVLYNVEEKTLEETAELCECSVSTVQRRLRKAKRILDRVRDL
jgi:RNA polymerase sigma-70 factor (ECF subfamily)